MSQTADPTANKAGCFPHEGDVGMRDFGATAAEAFIEQVTRSLRSQFMRPQLSHRSKIYAPRSESFDASDQSNAIER
jgi:hypothetical protein